MKQLNISLIEHETPKDIVIQYFRYDHPRMKEKNLLNQTTDFQLKVNGEWKHPTKISDLIDSIIELDIWGFCDKQNPEEPVIHYWIGEDAKMDRIKVMELFGHEIAHASGYSSENMAIKFGGITAFSYMLVMEEVFGLNPKNGKKYK